MNILSLQYLLFSAESSVFVTLFSGRYRKYTVFAVNCFFLYLLKGNPANMIYAVFLAVWTYGAGWFLSRKQNTNKTLLAAVAVPVLGLCFYKYAGYFGAKNLLMPIGISFYTFKGLSYLFDLHNEKLKSRGFIEVFDYVIFFPVFLAGPINRALPFFEELESDWHFDYADQKNGFVLAMLGLFEKLVIADQLGAMVKVFLSPELSGWYTLFGVILYAFHIYTDFDACSNVAIGLSRMMGFHITKNFHAPYLSENTGEFWNRWHISLSSWLKDYIYIPLGGNRKGTARTLLNILIVFLVSGIWHGSTILFLVWGLGHALVRIIQYLVRKAMKGKQLPAALKPVKILFNFVIVALLWVFFRSATLAEALDILRRMTMLNGPLVIDPVKAGITGNELWWTGILILIVMITDLFRERRDMIQFLADRFVITRWAFYALLIVIAVIFGVYGPGYHPEDFIYVTF